MPFKSEAQRRWMYANEPEMAKRWEKETPKGKKLPDKLKKKTAASKKQVHQLAEKLNIPWDANPKFMRWTEKLTGKTCLDKMDEGELSVVYAALKKRGKEKTAGEKDIYVYTALPKGARELVDRYGLMSAKNVLKNPEVLAAARRPEDREKFKADVKERVGTWKEDSVSGPSVFFGPPDWDKIHEKHYINKWDLQPSRINLSKLMRDEPGTRIRGVELVPYNPAWGKLSDKEYNALDERLKRKRALTLEEVRELAAKSPKELWKHYDSPEGTHYASDVPHAQVITPSGNILPKYIEHLSKWEGRPQKDTGVVAHIAGPSGSGKTTLLGKLKKKNPALVTKDLDDFDAEARRQLGPEYVAKKRTYTDEMLSRLYTRRQELLDSFLRKKKDSPVVLAGHHIEGPHTLKFQTRHKLLLSTGARESALRRSKRGSKPGIDNISKYRQEAKGTIAELRAAGYKKSTPKEIEVKVLHQRPRQKL